MAEEEERKGKEGRKKKCIYMIFGFGPKTR